VKHLSGDSEIVSDGATIKRDLWTAGKCCVFSAAVTS